MMTVFSAALIVSASIITLLLAGLAPTAGLLTEVMFGLFSAAVATLFMAASALDA